MSAYIVTVTEDPTGERWPTYIVGPFATRDAAEAWATDPSTWAFRSGEREVGPIHSPAERLHPDAAWERDHQ